MTLTDFQAASRLDIGLTIWPFFPLFPAFFPFAAYLIQSFSVKKSEVPINLRLMPSIKISISAFAIP